MVEGNLEIEFPVPNCRFDFILLDDFVLAGGSSDQLSCLDGAGPRGSDFLGFRYSRDTVKIVVAVVWVKDRMVRTRSEEFGRSPWRIYGKIWQFANNRRRHHV